MSVTVTLNTNLKQIINMETFKKRFDFLWIPSYPGMLTLMWMCILLAIAEIITIVLISIN
jgi:hypothetical protein